MLFFSARKQLERLYDKWREECGAKDCPFNVISFLVIEELIDEEAARQFIEDHEKELIPDGKKVTDEH